MIGIECARVFKFAPYVLSGTGLLYEMLIIVGETREYFAQSEQ